MFTHIKLFIPKILKYILFKLEAYIPLMKHLLYKIIKKKPTFHYKHNLAFANLLIYSILNLSSVDLIDFRDLHGITLSLLGHNQ